MKLFIAITSDISVMSFYIDYLLFLNKQKVDVIVATNFQSKENLSIVLGTGATPCHIPFQRKPNLKSDFLTAVRVYKEIKRSNPDVVIYATPKASLITSVASFLAGVPVRIYQLWGLRLETGSKFMRMILLLSERVVFRISTDVVSVSKSLSVKAESMRLGKATTILGLGSSHGVNIEKYNPNKDEFPIPNEYIPFLEIEPDTYFVTLVARLSRDKGVDTFIDAIDVLRKDSKLPIGVLVGDIEEPALSDLINSAISKGHVIHVSHTKDVRPYLIHATVNVLPSLREGLPNVVLEASAMGTPSVVSNATGCIDAVIDGKTGIVVPVSDVPSTANAIRSIAENKILRNSMREEGIKFVGLEFNQHDVFARNYQFLSSIFSD